MSDSNPAKTAILARMVMPDHVCPYGIKSKWLLEKRGYSVDDRWLTTREETDAFKREHGVDTTPQTFIDGKRIGGYTDLRAFGGIPQQRAAAGDGQRPAHDSIFRRTGTGRRAGDAGAPRCCRAPACFRP